jgi:DNA polymerase-3 subunit chi
MIRVDFYDGSARYPDDPLALALVLAVKASRLGEPVLMLAADDDQARTLDARLWQVGATEFVAHALADDPDAEVASVVIAAPASAVPERAVVINLRPVAVASPCRRIVELIPSDEAGRVAARSRWRDYQARGLKPARIDLPGR